MKVKGSKAAFAVTFDYFNDLGLTNDQAYKIKKGKEVDVDDKAAEKLIKAGYATSVKRAKPAKVEKKLVIKYNKKEESN